MARFGKLTARAVDTAAAGTHEDGAGLRLVVRASGARSWVLRYQMAGRRRDMGLGRHPEITLARARERAMDARRLVAEGIDPLDNRRKVTKVWTFEATALSLIHGKQAEWKNDKHRAQWRSTLVTYVFPALGPLDVAKVDTSDILQVLQPIWTIKPETASRVRQRIEAVLDHAATVGARTGSNPARWKGHLENSLAKPSRIKAVKHHAALGWRELPAFMADLLAREGTGAQALAFAILTAARSGEVRGATWDEIDLHRHIWNIDAARMKAGKDHRVPLTARAIELLGAPGPDGGLIFEGARGGSALSDMTLTAVLRRMGRGDVTAHGFRSSFRDWAGEATAHPREVIEHALAHKLPDRVEAAYARGDLFEKRRLLMADWESFVCAIV